MEQSSIEDDRDDDTWHSEEGVPRFTDPFIQKYLEGRDALVEQEKRQRSDRMFRVNLSPTAQEACSIVDQIRFAEQQTLWTRDYENSLATDGDVFPGMMFSLAKERMEKSKLWQIVRRMPKGALLHCHLEAMVEPEWLLDLTFETKGICILAPVPLTKHDDHVEAPFSFTYSSGTVAASEDTALWSPTYKANTPVPIGIAAETFPGGRDSFRSWFQNRTTITQAESISHQHGLNDIWRKFASVFPILGSLVFYEPIFRAFIRKMLSQLLEDGVRWVDIRSAFTNPFRMTGKDEVEDGYDAFFQVFAEELKAFKSSPDGDRFWGARFIWTTVRALDKRQVVDHMNLCILTKLSPAGWLIGGYDLVGQETLGRPLADMIPELFYFRKTCAQEGVTIPFFFHAGETLGDGDSSDENLFDAVLLGTRRLGHGFSLYKHPLLCDMVKEKRILVESCPVSNEVLRLTGSILSHPLPALLAKGVPASLCNDDPAVLGQGTTGMSHDFWQALQGWDNLGLAGLASLAENSVRWANFEDQDQKEWIHDIKLGAAGKGVRGDNLKSWIQEWERFCHWVVTEFGADEDLEPEE
ncbi:Metallo-dependent hydrolase [Saccharata proteae CBS 121410]|uniref:adenosine deaminase n=1 Tax=Saccharata proteae CBS 121410 TaxID=1314787 RepID=A0A9P4I0P2_9PEZI|nr:Metallo-dependent hydrolase [Saccharata proteae CBS 121410]